MILQQARSRTRSFRRGFSLLEIVVVLTVAAVVLGAAVVIMSSPKEEQSLREEHSKIEDMVRQGRALAVTYQQPFVIELTQFEAKLRPLANPQEARSYGGDERERSSVRQLEEMNWPRIEFINEDYEILIRRWGQLDFILLDDKKAERWILEPDGLCEPLSLKLSKDFGDISLARIYHPLTGLAEDEELTITAKR
ncbi:prepilin-type N-terminal cleavage/methylation domain-containing protein [Akkermansiaceae bacterium]|nr:prepilin-type N-terminal cleavage/methylation domain-containing protein [Akkermansiaceae bacterium]